MDADAEVERVLRDRRTREAVKVAESDERSETWYGLFGLRQFGYDFLDDAAGPGGKAVLDRIVQQPEQLAAIQLAQQIRIAEALERIASALERPSKYGKEA